MPSPDESHQGIDLPRTPAAHHIAVHDVRDALLISRQESARELRRAVASSTAAGAFLGLEIWGLLRGEPAFGWLIVILFAAFSTYFWRRRARAKEALLISEEALEEAEAAEAKIAEDGPPLPGP